MKLHQSYSAFGQIMLYLFRHGRYREIRNIAAYPRKYMAWLIDGRPLPPPSVVKHIAIREYARFWQCPVLIETGTFIGETVEAMLPLFAHIHSIELNPALHKKNAAKFRSYSHVSLYCGDSASLLPSILKEISTPCLFWLDGHYSGGSVRGDKITPIIEEVSCILKLSIKEHVLLIDDARLFNGLDGYPKLEDLTSTIRSCDSNLVVYVRNDIIRVHMPAIRENLASFPQLELSPAIWH